MDSILSTGEREVAELLAAGHDPAAIADARDVPVEQVELSIERIREKTERAYATLAVSPFAGEVAAALDGDTRRAVAEAIRAADADPGKRDESGR